MKRSQVFPSFFFGVVFNFSLPFPSSQTLFFLLVGQQISAVQRCSQSCQLQSVLTPALVRAVQQVTVTFVNWAGIGLLRQPLLF